MHLISICHWHEEKIKVKNEPLICEENITTPQKKKKKMFQILQTANATNMCDSTFKSKQTLKDHITSTHEEKKPFVCNICNTSFTQLVNLYSHVPSVYEGKKQFNCDTCCASFARKEQLNKHIEAVHEEKKPFKCNICNVSFSQKGSINCISS